MTAPKAEKVSLSARTTRLIYEHIRRNGLTKGDNLPSEMELSKLLEVSRNVVRESLKGLEAIGVVDGGNGRRAKVGAIDPGALGILIDYSIMTRQVSIQQVLDVRRSIENRAAALAAMRRTDVEAEQILSCAEEMQQSLHDRKALTALDVSFHKAIGLASRNPMHDLFIGAFASQLDEIAPIGWQTRPGDTDLVDIVQQHLPIAQAILDKDPARAELEMDKHFDLSVRALIASGYQ